MPSADSVSWLAAFMLIAGISFPLPFERISRGMLISSISRLPQKITEPVSSGKCRKIISNECEQALCYQSLQPYGFE